MRWFVLVIAIGAGCGFAPTAAGTSDGNAGDGSGGSGSDAAIDGTTVVPDAAPCWAYAPTNFNPCVLPAPAPLVVAATQTFDLDGDSTTLPRSTVMQTDGSMAVVVHLTAIDVPLSSTLVVHGTRPVILAVEGNVAIGGVVDISAGANDATRCATRKGAPGTASSNIQVGGGGGGGGAGADNGGDGTDGSDGTHSGHGTGGPHGAKLDGATALAPLVAGCSGGTGGTDNGTGTPGAGGSGGGALQISALGSIMIAGRLDAKGLGGGGTTSQTGGGGGGSGGAIFLEAPAITSSGVLCADGGAGGEGGGSSNPGATGGDGACTGVSGAGTAMINMLGGDGGGGAWKSATSGGNAGAASNASPSGLGAGGGGGGGSVGWIRIHVVGGTPVLSGVITPAGRTS